MYEKFILLTKMLHLQIVTLKPKPGLCNDLSPLMKYLDKKVDAYYFVRCTSQAGFVHYHGLLLSNEHIRVDTLRRYFNRKRVYADIKPIQSNFTSYWNYIHDRIRNRPNVSYSRLPHHRFGRCINIITKDYVEDVPAGGSP